ncbi:MAG TPA: DEAD/DEAH box helicase [Planctomycetota bacterium]|nr:DEAD/DEAH box helicase [Planctomycetota bacterium]
MQYAGFTLDPFQEQAIAAIDRGHSLIVAAPTGAGKTLIAEYAIEQAMQRGRQIVYTAPIKALSNQKFRDFSAKYPDRIGILTGDVSLNYRAPGLIMTTEIFRNTLLEDPERLASVDYVIFDEFHYIHDIERGTVWEESVIFAPESISFICLSATMPNLDELAGWMREVRQAPVEMILEESRPVPLEHAIWADGYGVHSLESLERLMHDLARGQRPPRKPHLGAEALLDHIAAAGRLPVLHFCFNRRLCEARAQANARRTLLTPDEARRVGAMFDELCGRFDVAAESSAILMGELVRRGVAFHHAGILPTLKEVVERLFTSGLIKMLFTTETFALGVNMPAQTVVLDSVEKFHGTHFGYLRAREYQQMSGRAGRRGMDTRGYVYARVDTEEVTLDGVKRVVAGRPERIESQFNLSYATILSLYGRWGERLFDACERSFAAYQRKRGHSPPRREKSNVPFSLRKQVERRLKVLQALGYLGKRGITEKGKFALRFAGYELQTTELFFAGLFHELNPHGINVLANAMIHEARRAERGHHAPRQLLSHVRRRATRVVRNIYNLERRFQVADPVRKLEFSLAAAVNAWSRGADFADLASHTLAAEGDMIRSLRMTIQILREMRRATDDDVLRRRLREAEAAINRGPVDAERQLRAGCEEPPPETTEKKEELTTEGTETTEEDTEKRA